MHESEITWQLWLHPSIIIDYVTHPPLYDTLLTSIEVPFMIPWAAYDWVSSSMWVRWLQVTMLGVSLGISMGVGEWQVSLCLWLYVLWFFIILREFCTLGIWRGDLLCKGEASVAVTHLSLQDRAVWFLYLGGFLVDPVFWYRVFPTYCLWLWELGPKPSVAGGVPWSIGVHRWSGWLPASSPRILYVVLFGVARCSVVIFGHVILSRTYVIF